MTLSAPSGGAPGARASLVRTGRAFSTTPTAGAEPPTTGDAEARRRTAARTTVGLRFWSPSYTRRSVPARKNDNAKTTLFIHTQSIRIRLLSANIPRVRVACDRCFFALGLLFFFFFFLIIVRNLFFCYCCRDFCTFVCGRRSF